MLYSLQNFISTVDIQRSEMPEKSNQSASDGLLNMLANLQVQQLDSIALTTCLVKSDLLRLVLEMPQNADDELMRIKTRLIITLLFKPLRNKSLIIESVDKIYGELPESIELLYERLHERLGEEIKTDRQSMQT